jgi:hypothetical protein
MGFLSKGSKKAFELTSNSIIPYKRLNTFRTKPIIAQPMTRIMTATIITSVMERGPIDFYFLKGTA